METIADKSYKIDEKKDFSPEEFAKAKTTCEFVIDLTKAISRSGYYDADHPVSMEVKKGLYDAFINALGGSSEIMLTCHDVDDKVDIHISGILGEPFNIRKLTRENTLELFVPKLKDYFERKSLNSFAIKKHITQSHFESFIDVMSEPIPSSVDGSKLGEYLTKTLVGLDITEVSTVFKNDIILSRGKLPWRVSIILRRLAKDLNMVPMFRSASAEKMKMIKRQIVEDIIRPLNNLDLFRDLIINCDIIATHLTDLIEVDEMEKLIINSLPKDAVLPVSQAVLEVYKENKSESQLDEDDSTYQQRCIYLTKVLNIAVERIISENLPDVVSLFEQLYEHEIVSHDMLPEKLRFEIQNRKLAGDVISQIDTYIDNVLNASSEEEMERLVVIFKRVIPEFIKLKEWPVINRIIKQVCDYSSRNESVSDTSELLCNLPDSVFEGSEEIFADEYIHANPDEKNQMDDILMLMKSMFIKIVSAVFEKSREPNVLKSLIQLLSKKGDMAREWSLKILGDKSQPISMLNIALLVIINVGNVDDINSVKTYVKYPNPSIRTKALSVIAKLNKKDAESMVIEALGDEEERVRIQAANIIERELTLSGESVKKILLFVKGRLIKKNITVNEAGFITGLIRTLGKFADRSDKEYLEKEISGIAVDLMKERTGLLKFIKAELSQEQMEILCACASALGKTGGKKSREYLKKLSNSDTALSQAAQDAIAELDKKSG